MTLVLSMKHTPSDPFSSCLLVNLMAGGRTDRVFGCDCPTEQVYKEGAKDVILSVLRGINCECLFCGILFLKLLRTCPGEMNTVLNWSEYVHACSNCFRVRPNEQWKDTHHERNYSTCRIRHIRVHTQGKSFKLYITCSNMIIVLSVIPDSRVGHISAQRNRVCVEILGYGDLQWSCERPP